MLIDGVEYRALWNGVDVETLPRERLIEIIGEVGRELERMRDRALSSMLLPLRLVVARATDVGGG